MTPLRLLMSSAAAALLLAGCGPAEAPPATEPAAAAPPSDPSVAISPSPASGAPVVALDGEGLRLVAPTGSTTPLAFGQDEAQVVTALTAALGTPEPRGENGECGSGPMAYVNWPAGLTAHFQEGRFVGWSLRADPAHRLTTMSGLGVGSTLAEVKAAYAAASVEETSLGHEVTAGGLSGLLDGTSETAKVETLWAGDACVFR